jgi:hypothetical protein
LKRPDFIAFRRRGGNVAARGAGAAAVNFCTWQQRVLPRSRLCPASQGRRPIRRCMIVGYAASSAPDIFARLIG